MRRASVAEFDHADSPWNRAAAGSDVADAFCCRTEWQLSFHDAFAPARALQLFEHDGSVIAFAERHDEEFGALLEPVEASWMFGCPLLGDDAVSMLESLLLGRARGAPGSRRPGPSVLISGIMDGSRLRSRIVATFRPRYRLFGLEPTILCSASLDGGVDGFLSRRTGSWRRNLRQQARRAEARGVHCERVVPRSAADVEAIYPRILAVERRSWKGIGRCGMAEPPSDVFYERMLRRLASSGGSRVLFARRGDEDIGFMFGGLAGTTYRGQQFSYDEAWRSYSIGNLLQVEQVRWLCEDGIARYDMGPLMDYKRHWTEIRTPIDAWLLVPAATGV